MHPEFQQPLGLAVGVVTLDIARSITGQGFFEDVMQDGLTSVNRVAGTGVPIPSVTEENPSTPSSVGRMAARSASTAFFL
jgi:hypothetical protein